MRRFVLEITACAALAAGAAYAQAAGSRVEMWLVNPFGSVDGMLLHDGRAFYFAPEVGRNLTLSVRMGDVVRVDAADGRRYLVDERDGSRTELAEPAIGGGPAAVQALSHVTARGHIAAFTRIPEGAVSGFILATGEQIRVPPTLGTRLGALRVGDMVTVNGLGTRGAYGTGVMAMRVVDEHGVALIDR